MISTEFSVSEKTGPLKSCLMEAESVNTWSCAALQDSRVGGRMRWGSAVIMQVQLLEKCLALMCSRCPLMTTEPPDWKHGSGSSSFHSCFSVFTLFIISWDPDPCFPYSKWWKSCWVQREQPGTPQTLCLLDAEIKQETLKCSLPISSACFFLDSWECS